MKTFIFCEDNGSATLVLSARNQKEADEYLDELVAYPDGWRFDGEEDDDDNDDEIP